MAGRQFNRLRKQLGEDLPPAPPSDESETDGDVGPQRAPFNPFDLLTDDEASAACCDLLALKRAHATLVLCIASRWLQYCSGTPAACMQAPDKLPTGCVCVPCVQGDAAERGEDDEEDAEQEKEEQPRAAAPTPAAQASFLA